MSAQYVYFIALTIISLIVQNLSMANTIGPT